MGRAKSARRYPNAPYWVMMREHEKKILSGALATSRNRGRLAAQLLGVPSSFFRDRCSVHGIDVGPLPGIPRLRPKKVAELPPLPENEAYQASEKAIANANRNLEHAMEKRGIQRRHERAVAADEILEEPVLDEPIEVPEEGGTP